MSKVKLDGRLLLAALELAGVGFTGNSDTKISLKGNACDVEMWDMELMSHVHFDIVGTPELDMLLFLPAAQLTGLIQKTEGNDLTIQDATGKFLLKAGDSKLHVPKLEVPVGYEWAKPADVPVVLELSKARLLGSLAGAIDDILGMHTQIRGFQMKVEPGKVTIFATDGHRFYQAILQNAAVVQSAPSESVVPVKVLRFLKELDTSEIPLKFGIKGGTYVVQSGDGRLNLNVTGALFDMIYPNMGKLFVSQPVDEYLVDAERLRRECDLHMAASGEKTGVVTLEFKADKLLMETRGRATVESVIEQGDDYNAVVSPQDLKVAVRIKYLTDAIKLCEALERRKTFQVELGSTVFNSATLLWLRPTKTFRTANQDIDVICILSPCAN